MQDTIPLRRMGPYAGVLPLATRPTDEGVGEVVVLVGQERYEPGWRDALRWSDFGGGVEPDVDRDEIEAAARECYEETMGMLGSRDGIESALRASAADGTLRWVRSPKGAVVFALDVPYDANLPLYFARAAAYAADAASHLKATRDGVGGATPPCGFPPEGYYEKTAVEWVPLDTLRALVLQALPSAEARASGRQSPRATPDPGLLRDDFVRTIVRFFD